MSKSTRKGHASDLLHIDDLELNGQKVDLNYYFTQEYTDIGQAAQELPNLIEWINAQLQVFYEDKLNAEQELKRAEADAYFELKSDSNANYATLYGGKVTEKALEYAVNRDEGVTVAWKRLNGLTAWVRRLHNLQQSLSTKLDLIRSSEATRRRLVDPAELELERETKRQSEEDES